MKLIDFLMSSSFIRGFMTCSCFFSLVQDFLGKDDYIAYIQSHWIDSSISVPTTIICLLFIFLSRK